MGDRVRTARRALLGAAAVLAASLALAPKPWNAQTGPGFFATPDRSMVETITTASWWAAALNLGLLLALLATARVWAGAAASPSWPRRARARTPVALWAALALAAALAGALRWPLAHGSLWWDEAWMVKRAVVGYREPAGEPPALEFHPVRWHWTVWHYKKPTNHVPYSIAARASLSAWRLATGAEPWAFNEFALRFPAWLAVFPSVVGLGWAVARVSTPLAGAAAAFLLAVHPWHLQHTAEARAYSFVILLSLSACALLALALRSGALRHWAAYTGCLALLLWAHPFTAYLALALAAAAAAGSLAGGGTGRDLGRRLGRVVAAHAAAAMLFLQVMAPNLAQVPLWTDVLEPSKGRVVHERSLANLASLVFAGLPLRVGRDEPEREAFPSLRELAERRPWLPPLVFGALPLLALGGLVRMARQRRPERWALVGLAAGAPLALLLAWAGDLFFHSRFVFYALLPATAGLAAGLDGLLRSAGRISPGAGRAALAFGMPLGLAGFAALGAPQTRILLSRPHAPMREVTELIARAGGLAALRAGYGTGGEMPALYDPWIANPDRAPEIDALCVRARGEGLPLYVFYGYPGMNRGRRADGFRRLDDPALFEPVQTFLGLDPRQVYTVLRYTGAPLP